MNSIHDLLELFSEISIPEIDANTQFWLIRTNGGRFYKEFVNNGYVALGWNRLTKETVFSKSSMDSLKDEIKKLYGESRPGNPINKCNRFINEIQKGDYALIPNVGSTEFAICRLGRYYEVDEFDVDFEKEELLKLSDEAIRCPYLKRREIKVLLTVSSRRLGLKLLKATSSYHGISSLNEYAEEILNCIYNCYIYKDSLNYTINIAKKEKIKMREFSQLMYSVTELMCEVVNDEDSISVTSNVNSPGKIVITLKNIYGIIKKKALPLLLVYLMLFGGSGFGFEFKGAASSAIDIIKELKTMDIQIEQAEEDLEGKRLENYQKLVDLIIACREGEIDIDSIESNMIIIEKLDDSLDFQSNQEFAHETNDLNIDEIDSNEFVDSTTSKE